VRPEIKMEKGGHQKREPSSTRWGPEKRQEKKKGVSPGKNASNTYWDKVISGKR